MKRKAKGRVLTGTLAFLLLVVFAVGATQLTLLGAQAYRAMVARAQTHNRERIVPAVIRSAVRAGNAEGAVYIEEIDGICCLTISSTEDDESYLRRLYVWEGNLCELFTSADRTFEPEGGETLCAARAMQAEIKGSLLTVFVTGADGKETEVCVALCGEGETP